MTEQEHPRVTIAIGDQAVSTALLIAERRLTKMGWRHTNRNIGEEAAEILQGLGSLLEKGSFASKEAA